MRVIVRASDLRLINGAARPTKAYDHEKAIALRARALTRVERDLRRAKRQAKVCDANMLEALLVARAGFRRLAAHHRDNHHSPGEMPQDHDVAAGLLALERLIAEIRRRHGVTFEQLLTEARA